MSWVVSAAELEVWSKGHPGVSADTDDVRLTIACARGDAAALEAFDARFRGPIAQAVRSMGDDDFVHEVTQLVRQRLLWGDGNAPPRIAKFGGRGSLGKFVQAVAVRTALNLRKNKKNNPGNREPNLVTELDGAWVDGGRARAGVVVSGEENERWRCSGQPPGPGVPPSVSPCAATKTLPRSPPGPNAPSMPFPFSALFDLFLVGRQLEVRGPEGLRVHVLGQAPSAVHGGAVGGRLVANSKQHVVRPSVAGLHIGEARDRLDHTRTLTPVGCCKKKLEVRTSDPVGPILCDHGTSSSRWPQGQASDGRARQGAGGAVTTCRVPHPE